jgi:hypothetical protein
MAIAPWFLRIGDRTKMLCRITPQPILVLSSL